MNSDRISTKRSPILLFDMDAITVDMTPVWMKRYYEKSGELVDPDEALKHWDWPKYTRYPDVCNSIIEEKGYFFDLPPMPGAVEAITELMAKKANILFITQPPRKADFAVKDKRAWILKHFPDFELTNIGFFHKKHLVYGDLLFDDSPEHLTNWYNFGLQSAKNGKDRVRATINYKYNAQCIAEWRFAKETAWEEFYKKVCLHYSL